MDTINKPERDYEVTQPAAHTEPTGLVNKLGRFVARVSGRLRDQETIETDPPSPAELDRNAEYSPLVIAAVGKAMALKREERTLDVGRGPIPIHIGGSGPAPWYYRFEDGTVIAAEDTRQQFMW